MAGNETVTIPLQCPVPNCGYVPPSNMSESGQTKALERHITMSHSLRDFPAVSDAMQEAVNGSVTASAEAPVGEPEPEPQPQTQPEPAQAVKVEQRAPRSVSKGAAAKAGLAPVVPISDDPKKQRIAERTERWATYLYDDFNPLLVSGVSQFAGIPEPWLDGGPNNGAPIQLQTPEGKVLTFWDPSLRSQLSFSQKDCKKLAKSGAIFAESTMGQVVTAWLEHNAHFIALGSALMVAGAYGWRVMRIKTEVGQLKELLQRQMEMEQPQTAHNPAA